MKNDTFAALQLLSAALEESPFRVVDVNAYRTESGYAIGLNVVISDEQLSLAVPALQQIAQKAGVALSLDSVNGQSLHYERVDDMPDKIGRAHV